VSTRPLVSYNKGDVVAKLGHRNVMQSDEQRYRTSRRNAPNCTYARTVYSVSLACWSIGRQVAWQWDNHQAGGFPRKTNRPTVNWPFHV